MPEIVASERTRRADARADREARKTGVEGHEAGAGESVPENEQAATAPPEQAREGNSAPERAGEPKQWTKEERQAAIDAERARQEARDREYERDNDDPGRTREP
jgi:hypothetical protein